MASGTLEVRVSKAEMEAINKIVSASHLALAEASEQFERAFTMAAAVRQIGKMITDEMMEDIMLLQGNTLGFRTDRDDKGGYSVDAVRSCLIEAVLYGAYPVGNEFNIIAGRTYYTKEYYIRRVEEHAAITDLHATPGTVEVKGGNAHIDYVAAWSLDGRPQKLDKLQKKLASGQQFDDRVVVRVNEKMGYDAIIGKAVRRMYREILRLSSLTALVPTDGDLDDVVDVRSQPVKPQRSTLFDETEPQGDSGLLDQAPLMQDYRAKLDQCQKKSDVGPVAKQAGGDQRLTDASRKAIVGWCTERRGEL